MGDVLLTAAEVAAIMGCSVATIRRRVADGTLQATRLTPCGPLRFTSDALPMEGNIMVAKRSDRGGWPYVDFRFTDESGIHQRVRVKCPSKDPRACRRFEQEVRAKVAAGVWRNEKETTVSSFAPSLIARLKVDGRKPAFVYQVERVLHTHLLPFFGRRTIRSIKPSDVTKYKLAKQHLSPKTVNNHLAILSRLLNVAVEDGIIVSVPKIKLHTIRAKEAPFFTENQAGALIAAAGNARLQTMIIVALGTGLRLGELLALKWEDIELDAPIPTLTVRRQWCSTSRDFTATKSGNFRVIPLAPHLIPRLSNWPRRLGCDLVFPTKAGKVARKDVSIDSFKRALKRAGLEKSGWHKCRHTFASWLVQRGTTLAVVQKLMGHASIKQTERYAHLAPTSLAEGVAVLG